MTAQVFSLDQARTRRQHAAPTVASDEPWLSKRDLARVLGCSTRWIEYRCAEGMPCERFGGLVRFQRGVCEDWLRRGKIGA